MRLTAFPEVVQESYKAVPKGQKAPLPKWSTALLFSPSALCAGSMLHKTDQDQTAVRVHPLGEKIKHFL